MSILNTKPVWAPGAIATAGGWKDPVTNELYVSVKNLVGLLEAEGIDASTLEPIQAAAPAVPAKAPKAPKAKKVEEVVATPTIEENAPDVAA